MSDEDARHDFAAMYRLAAQEGCADGPGGAEYRRVWIEYQAAGYPCDIWEFICERANADPLAALVLPWSPRR